MVIDIRPDTLQSVVKQVCRSIRLTFAQRDTACVPPAAPGAAVAFELHTFCVLVDGLP